MKCPACGAEISSFKLKCPECGFVFSQESDSSKEFRSQIKDLQTALLTAENVAKKTTLITTFTLPNTQEGLLSLLSFAYTQFHSVNGSEEEEVSKAWLEKAKQAYMLLKMQSDNDEELVEKLRPFKNLEDGKAKIKVLQSEKRKSRKGLIRWGIIIGVVVLITYLFLLVVSNMDAPSADEGVGLRQEVMKLIEAGKFDEARIKAAEAEYSWDERELQELIDQYENKK